MSIRTDLEAAWAEWLKDTNDADKRTQAWAWRRDNPGEWAAIVAYRAGTGPRPNVTSIPGLEHLKLTDAWLLTAPVEPPPPPPVGVLPFAEAQLRPGFRKVTTADIPVGAQYWTPPTSDDYLIDLEWVKRDRALKVYNRPGQRIHAKNVWIHIEQNLGGSAYQRGGFGYRPLTTSSAPAEHVSLTGYLHSGPHMTDGLTYGDQNGSQNGALRVTYQLCRQENASLSNGGKAAVESSTEHCDAFQSQGPFAIIEFGLCTFYRQWAVPGTDPGKGWMLNGYGGNGRSYTVDARKVNFRDYPGAAGIGAAWIKDYNSIKINLEDVFLLIEGNPSGSWGWSAGSGLFLNTAQQYGSNQPWTSSGSAPTRVASFPAVTGITGQVREGLPAGGDYVTRAALGL